MLKGYDSAKRLNGVSNPQELKEFLKGKPKEWASVIATRIGLRVALSVWDYDIGEAGPQEVILDTYRCLLISMSDFSFVRNLNVIDDEFSLGVAFEASSSANLLKSIEKSHLYSKSGYVVSVYALNSYINVVNLNGSDFGAIESAEAAAVHSVSTKNYIKEEFWRSINDDINILLDSNDFRGLYLKGLWLKRPSWVDLNFNTLRNSAWVSSPFNFWLAWYRAVVAGDPDSLIEEQDIVRLLRLDEDFWEPTPLRPPEQIMLEICKSVDWDWEKAEIAPLPPVERSAEDTLRVKAPPAPNPKASKPSLTSKRPASDMTQQGLFSDAEGQELDSETPEPERQPDPEPHLTDSADIQHDNPTLKDELGRSPFVEVMVDRLQSLHSDHLKRGQGFAINLHAPWGAGKSTILKMMETRLTTDRRFKDRWIVVNFNAWEHEHRKPPWWPLICAFRKQICKTLGEVWELNRADWIRMRWYSWRLLSDWLPYVLLVILVAAGVVMLTFELDFSRWENVLKILASTLAVSVPLFAVLRSFVYGSSDNARAFFSLRDNPLTKVSRFFKTLVALPKRPICVFIDDLDRCDADYVVELLEGIQTAFRHPNVVYVVAADRKWIKSAFEHRYKDAFAQVEGMGQPLGYLFLEKIFQLSTPLPAPSNNAQRRYWQKLLGEDGTAQSPARQPTPQELRALREIAQSRIETADTYEEIEAVVEQSEASVDSEALQDEIRSAAFERASRSETIEREAKHRLAQLSTIIPFNPRNMKRLLNTYTLRVGEGFSGGVKPEVLARWVVLEHSYPELTDLLAEQPELAKHFQEGADKLEGLPPLVQECRERKQVSEIFWKTVEGVSAPLTVEDVRKLTRSMV